MTFEHNLQDIDEVGAILKQHGARDAIIKSLTKNHNDKNQVYSGSDFQPLHPYFDFSFNERTQSVSEKHNGKHLGTSVLEAVFQNFSWINQRGSAIPARNVKMIIYPQYPEARLSGFQTVENTTPTSMTVEFTKANPNVKRYLVLGRKGNGSALGMMLVAPNAHLTEQIQGLGNAPKSRVWKFLDLSEGSTEKLKGRLSEAVGKNLLGCRFDKDGDTIPFNGTQVCGYTLEHACGILPNSDKNGDFEGIELKAHTQKKVTLFTPEPDLGLYHEDFTSFMTRYGYQDSKGNYRLTGIHRAGELCQKSGLTLIVKNYDKSASLASQADKDIHVGLYRNEELAAGWSLERLLNCWGAKHNEVVYVPASKTPNPSLESFDRGYKHLVQFERDVLWCKNTSADKLLQAIEDGIVFLDPAPKLDPVSPRNSKRRSQWRVNDISAAAQKLYDLVEHIQLH